MKNYVINEILKCIKKNKLNNKVKILILGISYKYGVSDLRNSLGLKIFSNLKKNIKILIIMIHSSILKINLQILKN